MDDNVHDINIYEVSQIYNDLEEYINILVHYNTNIY